MNFLAGLWGKIAAAGVIIAGILIAALRLISMGEARQKAKAREKQRDIEKSTKEILENEQDKSRKSLDKATDNVSRGDFSDFND